MVIRPAVEFPYGADPNPRMFIPDNASGGHPERNTEAFRRACRELKLLGLITNHPLPQTIAELGMFSLVLTPSGVSEATRRGFIR